MNTLHVLAIALLVGAIFVLDLRLLGLWRSIPVAVLARPAVAVASAGLALAILSGAALLSVQATEYVANPFLYMKFAAILAGLVNVAWLRRTRGGWTRPRHAGRHGWGGLFSLLAWLTALVSGRLIAYW